MENLLKKFRRTQSFRTRSWCRITDTNWIIGLDLSTGDDYTSCLYYKKEIINYEI